MLSFGNYINAKDLRRTIEWISGVYNGGWRPRGPGPPQKL